MSSETTDEPDSIFDASLGPPRPRHTPLYRPSPLRPMVFVALTLIAGIVVGRTIAIPEWSLLAGMILILALGVGGLFARRGAPEGRLPIHSGYLLFIVIFMFGWLRGGRVTEEASRAESLIDELGPRASVIVEGILAEPPQQREYGWRVVVGDVRLVRSAGEKEATTAEDVRFPLKIQAVIYTDTDVKLACEQGMRIALEGRVKPPSDASFPGDFDERLYLASHGIGAKLNVKDPQSVQLLDDARWEARMHGVLGRARMGITDVLHTFIGDPQRASLAVALLIGERSGLSPALNEAFARTGLVHILSVSGYHTGIVLLFILGFLRLFGLSPRTTAIFAIMGLAAYAALTGFNPPVVRAAFMGAFMMGGWALGRHTTLLSGLAVSAFLTLMHDPRNLFRPDWQLSYLCVFSITIFAPAIYELALPISQQKSDEEPSRWLQFFRREIWLPFVVVLALQIGMLPIQLHYFERVSLVGFIIQPLAVLSVMVSMGLSMLVCALAWMPGVAIALGWLAERSIALFEGMVLVFGYPDWVVLDLPRMPGWMVMLYIATMFLGQHLLKGRGGMNNLDFHQRRSLVFRLVLVLCFVAGLVWLPRRGSPTGMLEMYVVDVGQGDAIVLRMPNGETALIDGGRGWLSGNSDPDITRFLKSLGVRRIDLVVATHADADHIGGLPNVLKRFKIGRFIHGPDTSGSDLYDELRRELAIAPYPVHEVAAGDAIGEFGEVEIEVLNPLPGTDNNDASVALLVEYGEIEILLTGDIEAATERRLLESGRVRDIEVLKVAHHGSASSTTEDFLDAFDPEIALISVGRGNIYRHPSPMVIERLEERDITTGRTDTMGTLLVRTDGREVRLFSYGGLR